MRILFTVQGEGRGHFTQAQALEAILSRAGHELCGVLVGRSSRRSVPSFFRSKIGAPVAEFESPNFSTDEEDQGIRLLPTLLNNVAHAPSFGRSMSTIHEELDRYRPDLIINFYEPLTGLYNYLYKPNIPIVCVGHQYMFDHPGYSFPAGHDLDRTAIRLFTRITALGAQRKLGLSLYQSPDQPDKRITVVPPLLRPSLFDHADNASPMPTREPFLLIYLVNHGYARRVIDWHVENREMDLHCFWDNPNADPIFRYDDQLTFHRLHDVRFLELMAQCAGLVCTAGFESVSEAMYLDKPILAVPVEGHFEQLCNAREVVNLHAGLHGTFDDLGRIADFAAGRGPVNGSFRRWVNRADRMFTQVIEEIQREVVSSGTSSSYDPVAYSSA